MCLPFRMRLFACFLRPPALLTISVGEDQAAHIGAQGLCPLRGRAQSARPGSMGRYSGRGGGASMNATVNFSGCAADFTVLKCLLSCATVQLPVRASIMLASAMTSRCTELTGPKPTHSKHNQQTIHGAARRQN